MSNKTVKKVNGGVAIYYGISLLLGALSGLIGTGTWLYKVFTGEREFSWFGLGGLILTTGVLGAIGYVILRVGYEEMEE